MYSYLGIYNVTIFFISFSAALDLRAFLIIIHNRNMIGCLKKDLTCNGVTRNNPKGIVDNERSLHTILITR